MRELKRLPVQLGRAPSAAIEYLFATAYHDAFLSKRALHTLGQRSLTDRVAIYVMFPKSGLTKLHQNTINHLNEESYSPIVVVNGKLNGSERDSIISDCHLLIERENFGYDFGAYRTGLLQLASLSRAPEYVALINDSCWFPVEGSRNWLKEAEALNVDMASALTYSGSGWVKRVLEARGSSALGKSKCRKFHHCSFALLFSRVALDRDEFWRFWQRIHLSSDRRRTVKWGERALSTFLESNGFSMQTTLSEEQVAFALLRNGLQDIVSENDHPAYVCGAFLEKTFKFPFRKQR